MGPNDWVIQSLAGGVARMRERWNVRAEAKKWPAGVYDFGAYFLLGCLDVL